MMKLAFKHISALLLLSVILFSCRGQTTDKPPVRHHFNMNFQDRFNAQEENPFFEDGRAMRMPVEGTVARGNLRDDTAFFEGTDQDGNFLEEIPVDVTRELIYKGKERYDIFCQVCHGGTGDGRGIIMTENYGYVPAPSFHTETSRNMAAGQFFDAITNGIRNMPAYGPQIPVEDRWAIVSYIRALQESQHVPESEMDRYDIDLAQLRQVYEEEQQRAEELAAARAGGGEAEISAERGEELYIRNACQACHSLDGSRLVGPTFQGLYGSERTFDDGSTLVADEEYIIESITEPGARVVEGFDNAMVPYTHLSDDELQSLVEFIRSLSDE